MGFRETLLFVLLFASFASALNIDAPSSVPENISWGFSVGLDATDSWSKTTVEIDDKPLLDVYSNGTIIPDPYNGQFVLKSFVYDSDPKSTGGLTLFVSHFGLPNGAHTLSVSSGSVADSHDVNAFAPLDSTYREQTDIKITNLEQSAKEQQADNDLFWKRIAEMDSEIVDLGGTLDDYNRFMKAKIARLEEWIAFLDVNQSRTDAALLSQEQAKQNARISGFFNIASDIASPIVMAFFAIIVLIALVFIGLKVKENLPSGSGTIYARDDYGLPISKEHEEMADALSEPDSKGKWASKKM